MDVKERQFAAVEKLGLLKFGALWWGRDDLIKRAHPQFVRRDDRIGHPLACVMRQVQNVPGGAVPMLLGTSKVRSALQCVAVRGMTRTDPARMTYFGSFVYPGRYTREDVLDGMIPKSGEITEEKQTKRREVRRDVRSKPWHKMRTMHPNWDKLAMNAGELAMLEGYCAAHGF